MEMKIYTDGAATLLLENENYIKGPGGWAYAVMTDNEITHTESGGAAATTNQEMELTAIYKALSFAAAGRYDSGEASRAARVIIYSDSAYSINIYTQWIAGWERNGWRRKGNKEICNLKVIKAIWNLIKEMRASGVEVDFEKVAGHSGDRGNEVVDKLAVAAKRSFM